MWLTRRPTDTKRPNMSMTNSTRFTVIIFQFSTQVKSASTIQDTINTKAGFNVYTKL